MRPNNRRSCTTKKSENRRPRVGATCAFPARNSLTCTHGSSRCELLVISCEAVRELYPRGAEGGYSCGRVGPAYKRDYHFTGYNRCTARCRRCADPAVRCRIIQVRRSTGRTLSSAVTFPECHCKIRSV